MTGTVFNIQRFSLFDGPGVRTVVFLKGCPLRCEWCHNPEGLSAAMQIMYNADRCIGCGACADICPHGCHIMADGMHGYDRTECVACGKCAEECYSLALTAVGNTMTVEEVLQKVLRDAEVYSESGGGLTLSGGEPFMQGAFSTAILKAAKEAGVHTCVETSGFVSAEILRKAAPYIDLFLFDYKVTGNSEHKAFCGVPQDPILNSLALLDSLKANVVLRCPFIPKYNDTKQHRQGIANVVRKYQCICEVQVEPYHRLGISKSMQLGVEPTYDGKVPEKQVAEAFAQDLRNLCGGRVSISVQ